MSSSASPHSPVVKEDNSVQEGTSSASPHSPVVKEDIIVPEGMSSADIKEQKQTDVQADQKKTTQTKRAPRIKRPCPVPECQGAMYTNIWNHLFQTHKAQNKYSGKY